MNVGWIVLALFLLGLAAALIFGVAGKSDGDTPDVSTAVKPVDMPEWKAKHPTNKNWERRA